MKNFCDLHTHSTFSDGTYTPTEIINSALNIGLSAVALCDHNTVDGLPEFISAAENKNIEAIAGAEFSVDFEGAELHLLGLFIPQAYFSHVSELMAVVQKRKERSNIALIESLNKVGYAISYNAIKKRVPNGNINRAHIAEELTKKNYTKSIEHAFNTLLSPKAGHYKAPARLAVWGVIDFIKSINAVPVLAHPFINLTEDKLTEFIPLAKEHGLIGMECIYSSYDNCKTELSLSIAKSFDLKPSGGSDFHGETKPDIQLGVGKGNLKIPYEWAKNLKNS